MLALLLDEHISPVVAKRLNAARPEIPVTSLQAWHDGAFLGVDDGLLLRTAFEEGRTLVTYDKRTLWPLLQDWAEQGMHQAGVVFVSRSCCPPSDIGALVRALAALWDATKDDDWTDRAVYL